MQLFYWSCFFLVLFKANFFMPNIHVFAGRNHLFLPMEIENCEKYHIMLIIIFLMFDYMGMILRMFTTYYMHAG